MATVGYARVSTTGQSLDTTRSLIRLRKDIQGKSAGQRTTVLSYRQCWNLSGRATQYR
jgi:DNA invertase Pin-like site-specific DNA recombinase